jgi:hypothetical protein
VPSYFFQKIAGQLLMAVSFFTLLLSLSIKCTNAPRFHLKDFTVAKLPFFSNQLDPRLAEQQNICPS